MRLLIYGLNYAPEPIGIGRYSGEMAPWLVARGHEVRVITAPPYYPAWKVGEGFSAATYAHGMEDGVTVTRCPLWVPRRRSGINRILHLMSFALTSLPPLAWAGGAFRPDIVLTVAPALFCAPGGWLVAKLSGAKAWLHIQDFEVEAAFGLGLLDSDFARSFALSTEEMLLRRFDRVSTITPRMRERLAAKGVSDSDTVLFPNWTDLETIRPLQTPSPRMEALRAELGLKKDTLVVLYSGNLGEKQGMETLVETARKLEQRSDIAVVLCGDGAAAARLGVLAKTVRNLRLLPLQPAETFNDLLNLAQIHLLPQRSDAADLVMPSKLGAMLASGRPVVAGAREETALAREVADCGMIAPPEDSEAMAAAICHLADDAAERQRLGENARHRAETEWDRETLLSRFEAALLAICPNQG